MRCPAIAAATVSLCRVCPSLGELPLLQQCLGHVDKACMYADCLVNEQPLAER